MFCYRSRPTFWTAKLPVNVVSCPSLSFSLYSLLMLYVHFFSWEMPVANDRLAKLQVLKLIQAVRDKDHEQIRKLVDQGLPDLVNFSGRFIIKFSVLFLLMNLVFCFICYLIHFSLIQCQIEIEKKRKRFKMT